MKRNAPIIIALSAIFALTITFLGIGNASSTDIIFEIVDNTGGGDQDNPGGDQGNTGGNQGNTGGNTGSNTGGNTGGNQGNTGGGNQGNTGGGGGSSSGGPSSSGGSSSGGSSSGGHDNNRGEKLPGSDSSGDNFYLRPGISIDKEYKQDGFMLGRSKTEFEPLENLTRAEFAVILDRVFVFEDETITKTFNDIQNHWAKSEIERLASNGIIMGISSREFDPEGSITRDQVLLMLSRIIYTDKFSEQVSNVNLSNHYDSKTLAKMISSGIYESIPTNYDISSEIKRNEMVYLISRLIYTEDYDRQKDNESFIKENGILLDIVPSIEYYENCLISLDISKLKGGE